jgi:type IX secretion system PorP/SprF family membrane protein
MKIRFLACFILYFQQVHAQDIFPNQFASATLGLNPAFTGTSVSSRANFLYRVQYPTLAGTINSNFFSFDHNFEDDRNSLGFFIQNDRTSLGAGGDFRVLQANASYAYLLPAGEYWRVKLGLAAGYGNQSLNSLNLLYGDQLDATGFTNSPTQDSRLLGQTIDYFNVATGVLAYNGYAWIGASVFNLGEPRRDFLGSEFRVFRRYSGHLGIKIPLDEAETNFISTAAVYRLQNNIHLLDAGIFYEIPVWQAGIWYRNIPIQAQGSQINFQTSFKHQGFRLSYSYGMPIGALRGFGGSHEVGVSFALQKEPQEYRWSYVRLSLF